MKIHLLLNAKAGRASQALSAIPPGLAHRLTIHKPNTAEAMTSLAKELGQKGFRVVAGGGDGTLRDVARGLLGTTGELAVLPLGTANLMARDLGVCPGPLSLAWHTVFFGQVNTYQPGFYGSELFLCCMGVGLDALTCGGINLLEKERMGRLAYLSSALRVWQDRNEPWCQIHDGPDAGPYAQALFLASRRYGGSFDIAPWRRPGQTPLNALLLPSLNFASVFRVLNGGGKTFLGENQSWDISTPGGVQLDGDFVDLKQGQVCISKDSLKVLSRTGL